MHSYRKSRGLDLYSPSPSRRGKSSSTHLNESLIVHVQQLIKFDPVVLVLPEGTGRLLGSGFLAGGESSLKQKMISTESG